MMKSGSTLCLEKFYPETDLMITDVKQQNDKILFRMKSISSSCKCPKYNCITEKYHGIYNRKVQDLPLLSKNVRLEICAHEYKCVNDACEATSVAETKRLLSILVRSSQPSNMYLEPELSRGCGHFLDYYRAPKGAFLCIQKNKRILHYGYIIKQSL